MKNIRPGMLKTCIFLTADEYMRILKEIFGEGVDVEFSLDGIWVGYSDPDTTEEPDVEGKLAEYFGVDLVTSIHMDDWEPVGIWICYTDKKEEAKK